MDDLQSMHYQLSHLWRGQKASGNQESLVRKSQRSLSNGWQDRPFGTYTHHLQSRPHYEVTIPNEMHQFDLLYMPSDMLYGNKYSYILSGIDVASRYKVTRPLRRKQVKDVADIIANIYKVGPLTYPKVFQCDNGSEFKAEISKRLKKHGVTIWCTMTKYKHTHTAFVEALNKLLAEQLCKVQDVQELNNLKSCCQLE